MPGMKSQTLQPDTPPRSPTQHQEGGFERVSSPGRLSPVVTVISGGIIISALVRSSPAQEAGGSAWLSAGQSRFRTLWSSTQTRDVTPHRSTALCFLSMGLSRPDDGEDKHAAYRITSYPAPSKKDSVQYARCK